MTFFIFIFEVNILKLMFTMKRVFQNILAIIIGVFIGGVTNMFIVSNSSKIVSLPDGVIPGDMESLTSNIHLFEPVNFLMPFLAHSIGTLIGSFLASKIAVSHKFKFSIVIGVFFLIGGIQISSILDSPLWFDIVDIFLAYIPMSIIGYKLAVK